jgi:arylsulfatase A-like enzyme
MQRRTFLQSLAAGALAAAPRRPNFVFILADDLGWQDTSLYGSKYYETPNIDALARRGMMFTQAYAANPLCSPTRSSILTGLYPARIGITTPSCHMPEVILEKSLVPKAPADQKALTARSLTRLKQEYVTLAELLKKAGYATAHFGKWHLGSEPYDPLHQGFDTDLPHTPAPGPIGGYLGPWSFWKGQGSGGEHIEDRMSEEAGKFIAANKGRPFYVNYWAFSVHTPWQAKQDLIEKYKAKTDQANPQHNPVYAAMVESFDQGVGSIIKALDENGVADNTFVVLFADNGGVHWSGKEEPAMLHPGYESIPATSNAPLRGGKATLYEGGTREPCIIVWPGQVKPGSRSDAVISSIDFYPTILDAAGLKPDAAQTPDGISILPALRGGNLKREAIFCHFPHYSPRTGGLPGTWVRRGDWKLIRLFCEGAGGGDGFELYNLKDDLSEATNLASRHPGMVREMNALIDGFLRRTQAVVPTRNPAAQ